MLLAKRMIAGFNLKRPQEELTVHKGKGWPVRLRALACREEVGGWQGAEVRRQPVPDCLREAEDTAVRVLLFSQLLWRVISPKRGRWRRHRRFEEKEGYQGHCS